MNKLIKQVEFGELKFKIAINRDIALKVSENFPEFINRALTSENLDVKEALKNGTLRQVLEESDYITSELSKVIKYALPLILSEAGDKTKADDIIEYAIENEADDVLNSELWGFILLGFTNKGVKTPKVSFKMK